MRPFEYSRASSPAGASAAAADPATRVIAGGTNLLDLMKEHVETPERLVDLGDLPLSGIEESSGGIQIGALARMSDVAADARIRTGFPVVSEALLASASPQLRNMASIGGNVMQRTRCPYFRDVTFEACNKRKPGSGCAAIAGENRMHAILGTSPACIATHPSDLAVALAALDAVVELESAAGRRTLPLIEFHRLPGDSPQLENELRSGEIITAVFIPAAEHARRSHYLKVRDRASFEFAVTSAAAGLATEGDRILSARLALGGVGTKPWRSHEAERVLTGEVASKALFHEAAEAALRGAVAQRQNGFKIELAKRTIVRALETVAGDLS